MPPRSPLAPETSPSLPPLAGVRLAARACGVRYQGRTDVCLMEFAPGTAMAEGASERVSTPAMVVPGANSIRQTSVRR